MTRPGQISLAHLWIVLLLVAVGVGLVCQAAAVWFSPWAHEFVISPLLYGAIVFFGMAADRLRFSLQGESADR
jgi:hypothetical protein